MLTAAVGCLFLAPAARAGTPAQDSVVTTGSPSTAYNDNIHISAFSGPSGESPTGEVRLTIRFTVEGPIVVGGPVTCLAVSGNRATIKFRETTGFGFGIATIEVVDGQPDVFDAGVRGQSPSECSPPSSLPSDPGLVVSGGDVTVVDAPPQPTTMHDCKHGGWRSFGFKSQGRCLVFVLLARICEVLERRGHHPPLCPPAAGASPRS